ncbi:MAG: hypothetical protein IT449_09075 [Phycisphaerales bacterium]|nr:hypothetical protein [Phycisphaerales bacterium]
MKVGIATCCVLIVVLCAPLTSPLALARDEYTWVGYTDEDGANWFEPSNWSPSTDAPPGSDDSVIIPATLQTNHKMPVISSSSEAYAQKLTINRSGSNIGKLTVLGSTSVLILGDGSARTSTINGQLVLGDHGSGSASTMKVNGDHTVIGAGGEILLVKQAIIDENTNNGSDKLTIKRSGQAACDDYPDGLACNVLLHGEGEVKVQLDNRGFVIADDEGLDLVLSDRTKTGTSDGWWIAESNARLVLQTKVNSSCHWHLGETNCDSQSTLFLDTGGCTAGFGPVTFTAGIFEVTGGNFCTSGNIVWKSVYDSGASEWTAPAFKVTSDKTAKFGSGAVSCTACP